MGGVAHLLLGQAAQLGYLVGDGLLLLLVVGKVRIRHTEKKVYVIYEYEPIK